MDDLSCSNIHEDVIILSTRKLNAFSATIESGSTIVLGGNREMFQDVLRHRLTIALKIIEANGNKNDIRNTSEGRGGDTESEANVGFDSASTTSEVDPEW